MESGESKKHLGSSWFVCGTKCLPIDSSSKISSPSKQNGYDEEKQDSSAPEKQRKPGGWKAMPFVLGNETFERLANMGLTANFMMFLMTQFHMDQVSASNVLSISSACSSFLPLLGAFICDAYAGRFLTLSVATISSFLGMLTLTLVAWLRELHPPACNFLVQPQTCKGPTAAQMVVLVLALIFLSIGSAGIRPCNIPFGVDQFDPTTEEGRKGINSFFNWYYTTFTVVLILALTVVVYIQDNVSWLLGFGIPTILMFCGIILFFLGMRVYVYVKPEGSVFADIAQAISATYKKRKLKLPAVEEDVDGIFYNPPPKGRVIKKLPLTNQFRFLNRAALIVEGDLNPDGSRADKWRLSSVQSIEEVKCLLGIMPIWASGIICFTAIAQQGTFTMSQALKMDRSLGPHFQVPPGSMGVLSLITVGIVVPLYDRMFVPLLRKRTKIEGGITLLQRIGIGFIFSVLSMFVAGLIERKRRASAIMHGRPDGVAPISVFWLSPQLILMGLCEAFNIIGQIEFYNKEFPDNMLSVANSMFSITVAGANYISIIIVNVIHKTTGGHGHPDWLTKDINRAKLLSLKFKMKATTAFLTFLLFSICTHSFFCLAAEEPEAVIDTAGKKLRAGVKYYIQPVTIGFTGGLTASSFGNETCPLSVVQSPIEVDPGNPVTFTPVNSKKGIIRVSTDLNIRFSTSTICIQSNVWKLGYDKATGKYVIFTNGVEGNPGPKTISNWFKIEKYQSYYKLVFCPTVCNYCKVICKDVGAFIQDRKRRLALTSDQPLRVAFRKA